MYVILAILLCAFYGFYIGKKKPLKLIQDKDLSKLNSNPKYYGYYIETTTFFHVMRHQHLLQEE